MVLTPPPARFLLTEWPRAAWGLASLPFAQRRLNAAPRGDRRPVLLLPGMFNGDRSNAVLRNYLNRIGYRAFPWALGHNFGPRTIGAEAEKLFDRIEAIRDETGEKVTLIGVSLGGIMARIAAQRRTELVREVITISSPFAGPATANHVWRAYEVLVGERIGDAAAQAFLAEAAAPLPVPATAIWSRSDGLVAGLACQSPDCRNIEINSSHLLVQLRPEVLLAVAEVLAGKAVRASSEALPD
jgi:pimeloyl-ACP methyl ester carboxylesterase